MVFSSFTFIFAFLPLTLAAYYLCPPRGRNAVLLFASLFFYAWGAPRFVFVLVGTTWVDWMISRAIAAAPPGAARRRQWLVGSLVLNLGLLGWFKYANFGASQVRHLGAALGLEVGPWVEIALPLGISFFTFHKISYVVDVYRKVSPPAPSFGLCLLYICLFPHLIAGPIVRYRDVDRQLVARDHTVDRFLSGICRFCLGLAKKVLVANVLAETADKVFDAPSGDLYPAVAWVGVLAYSFQIYFDFSGYSDMAIGLGRMFGIEFLENFDRPYLSRNFTEFWQRWHISLSRFMRDYLFFPLGGNRLGAVRGYVNLWIVFLLSGLWHGAAWTFVVWGAYQGLFLSLDRLFWGRVVDRLPRFVSVAVTFFLLNIGWAFFRAADLESALAFLSHLFVPGVPAEGGAPLLMARVLSHRGTATMVVAAVICFLPGLPRVAQAFEHGTAGEEPRLVPVTVLGLLLLVLSFFSLANSGYNPFIYFRF
jgi:alginate O-acetyltransferase complex protein AlgI